MLSGAAEPLQLMKLLLVGYISLSCGDVDYWRIVTCTLSRISIGTLLRTIYCFECLAMQLSGIIMPEDLRSRARTIYQGLGSGACSSSRHEVEIFLAITLDGRFK